MDDDWGYSHDLGNLQLEVTLDGAFMNIIEATPSVWPKSSLGLHRWQGFTGDSHKVMHRLGKVF